MGFIIWIILGALSGWLASIIMGKNHKMGAFANIIVGVIGANIGGAIASGFGGSKVTGLNIYSIFISVIGAMILLFVINLITGKK